MINKVCAHATIAFAVLEVLLLLVSWIVGIVAPDLHVHSLLESDGIRWLFGHLMDNLLSPVVVWLVLAGMAYGIWHASYKKKNKGEGGSFRGRMALVLCAAELIAFLIIMLLLTCVPQAVLLSAEGNLFPSSFSRSIIPVTFMLLTVMGITYGIVAGSLRTAEDIFQSMCKGVSAVAPLLIVLLFAVQFCESLTYVLP